MSIFLEDMQEDKNEENIFLNWRDVFFFNLNISFLLKYISLIISALYVSIISSFNAILTTSYIDSFGADVS